jgi:Arc/MetJ family transcription regulator
MCMIVVVHTHLGVDVRTNIDIDDDLLAAAQAAAGTSTKKETVQRGLEALVRLGKQSDIRRLRGKLSWEGDLDAMRRDAS